jgi:formylglycine-generating enzyme required for sulfatase activity
MVFPVSRRSPICLVLLRALVPVGLAIAFVTPPSALNAPIRTNAAPKNYTETLPGGQVSFDMVALHGGAFERGSPADERGRNLDEGPRHPVAIRPFWMAKTEVTWDEYNLFRGDHRPIEKHNEDALAENADAITRPTQTYPDEYRGFGNKGHPVVGVSHHAAMEYCRWLSQLTGKTYRLPTEAEWEYACRAGTNTAYFFGSDPGKLGDYAWFAANSGEETHPVGKKLPNPWGLYDIYGNVAEWCLDHYQSDLYKIYSQAKPTLGPVLVPTAARFPHVVRGGSWEDAASKCRSAARRGSDASWNKNGGPDVFKTIWWLWDADFVGFRVVRPVEEQDDLKGIRSKVTKRSR